MLLKETRTLPIACTMQEGLESKYLLTDRAKSDMEYIVEACNNYDKLKEDNALLLDALKEVLIWGSVKGKQFTYITSPDKRDEFMNLINKIEQSK